MAKRLFREPSIETRQKMSAKKSGSNNPNYGKPRDEKTKKTISEKLTAYWALLPTKEEYEKSLLNKE